MGYDLKYGTVTVENVRSTPIGEDEPVVLFRSTDRFLAAVLTYYKQIAQGEGTSQEHIDGISSSLEAVMQWQTSNPELVGTPGETNPA